MITYSVCVQPVNQIKGKKTTTVNGLASKQKLDKNQPKKTNGTNGSMPVQRNNSSKGTVFLKKGPCFCWCSGCFANAYPEQTSCLGA